MKIGFVIGLFVLFFFTSCERNISIDYQFTDRTVEHAQNVGDVSMVSTLDAIPAEAYVLRLNLFPFEDSRTGVCHLDSEALSLSRDFNNTFKTALENRAFIANGFHIDKIRKSNDKN